MPRRPRPASGADPDLPQVLLALSDPVRLSIVSTLAESEDRACGSFGIALAPSTLSHHFRVLREARLITQRGDGTRKLTRLNFEETQTRFPGLLEAVLASTMLPADPPSTRAARRSAGTTSTTASSSSRQPERAAGQVRPRSPVATFSARTPSRPPPS